jgi:hypothetical protein
MIRKDDFVGGFCGGEEGPKLQDVLNVVHDLKQELRRQRTNAAKRRNGKGSRRLTR